MLTHDQACRNFASRQAATDKSDVRAFLKNVQHLHAPEGQYLASSIYPFPWGFISETDTPVGIFWEICVRKVWESGAEHWFDRFITAFYNLGVPVFERAEQAARASGTPFMLSWDDGMSTGSALSLACVSGDTKAARAYFACEFVPTALPDLIEKALDPSHGFERNYHCA